MVSGGMKLSKFKQMSLKELRKYVLEHREDEQAWREYADRPRPNATIVSAQTPLHEQEQIFKKLRS